MDGKALEIKGLTTKYRSGKNSVTAVNNVSFTLNRGETIGIVGESGSGKSALGLSIMRLIAPSSGKVTKGEVLFHFDSGESVDILKCNQKELRKMRGNVVSMIFQEPMTSLNPVMSILNQVKETILQHENCSNEVAKRKTIDLFEDVHLPNPELIFDRYPHQLSGGQKQRVMVAMAMSCHPSVLIADEATTSLDVTVQATVVELIKKVQNQLDTSTLFITHDLNLIGEIADRIMVMYNGVVVEEGKVEDVFKTPKHPYTKALLACRPPLNKRLKRLPIIEDFMRIEADGSIREVVSEVAAKVTTIVDSKEERAQRHQVMYAKEPLLRVKNLKAYFPGKKSFMFNKTVDYVKAVDDISFDVYPGETLGLVGDSGSGKTSLSRALLGLMKLHDGEVIFMGKNIMKQSSNEMRSLRKEMQIIFQDPYSSLNPLQTVGEIIMEPMKVHGILGDDFVRNRQVMKRLHRVKLGNSIFHRCPHELSGGQRQRVGIARALALGPKFIVCDESVSALDVSVQAQVLNLLNTLKKEFNFTYIFISHDLSVVKFMSDRILVMSEGKIVEAGDADEIYYNPKTKYTQKLIAAIPKGLEKVVA